MRGGAAGCGRPRGDDDLRRDGAPRACRGGAWTVPEPVLLPLVLSAGLAGLLVAAHAGLAGRLRTLPPARRGLGQTLLFGLTALLGLAVARQLPAAGLLLPWSLPLLLAGPVAGIRPALGAAALAAAGILLAGPGAPATAWALGPAAAAAALGLALRALWADRPLLLSVGAGIAAAALALAASLPAGQLPSPGAATPAAGLVSGLVAGLAAWLLQREERRAAELEAARERERRLRDAERAQAGLLAQISRELRAPLADQLGMLELLRDLELPARERGYLEALGQATRSLRAVAGDVRDQAQLAAGSLPLAEEEVALRPLLEAAVAGCRDRAAARGLSLRLAVDPALPERLRCDAGRLRQILSSLLGSLVAAAGHGSVVLEARPEDGGAPAAGLLFEVVASGLRLPAEALGEVFGAGLAPGPLPGADGQGGGLALAVSRGLAERMGGSLEARPAARGGTAFRLILPARGPATVAPGDARAERPAAAPAPGPGERPLAGLRVLVAEDSSMTRLLLGELLKKLGAVPYLVKDGRMAVNAARINRFDLVLMDMQLPVLDGAEAAREIRALGGDFERLPILGLTADAASDTQRRSYAAGLDGLLHKPVESAELVSAIAASRQVAAPPAVAAGGPRGRPPAELIEQACGGLPTYDPASQGVLADSIGAERVREIVALWPGFAGEYLGLIEGALKADDGAGLARAAHSIKGTAGYLGYVRLEALCLLAQRAPGDAALLAALAPEIAREIRRTLDHFAQLQARTAAVEPAIPEGESAASRRSGGYR